MKVFIDGVEYAPKVDLSEIKDDKVLECLKVLTSMRYFEQNHKMMGNTYEAIAALSPELAELPPKEAYDLIHGDAD